MTLLKNLVEASSSHRKVENDVARMINNAGVEKEKTELLKGGLAWGNPVKSVQRWPQGRNW